MAGGFNPDEYNTVAERIEAFTSKYPDGSLQSEVLELSDKRVVMRGYAYRSPADERPGIGTSAMPIPATNAMLRNSEIETAETSAWGRAIAALGFEVRKGVATKNEVDAKHDDGQTTHDEGLIGIAEVGKARDSDFELRQTPEGMVLGFRLTNGRKGWKVLTKGQLAEALSALREAIEGQRITVWGRMVDESFTPKGGTKPITYQVIHAERIQTPDYTLPATVELTPEERDLIAGSLPDEAPTEPLFPAEVAS